MKHQFELEQDIMTCWGVVDDLKIIRDSDSSPEEIINALNGLYVIADMRFKKLFSTFEDLIHDHYKNNKPYDHRIPDFLLDDEC